MKKTISILLLCCSLQCVFTQSVEIIDVYAADKVEINSNIYGLNNDWKTISDEAFPTFFTTFSNIGLNAIRYPGGWESEWLDWRTNTAPGWTGGPETPGASITTIKSNVSNYSIVLPTQTAMVLTYGTSEWNKEVDTLKKIAKIAIDSAGPSQIKFVEIGNEWWLQWAGGKSRGDKLINYSKIAMKIAGYLATEYPDRTFNILINGDFTLPDEFTDIKNNFTESYNEIDGLALHTYTGYQPELGKEGYNTKILGANIDACANNFNSEKDLLVYCSEWMAARAYNEQRLYMEAANIIPNVIEIYARHSVDAAAYWPPVNNSAGGVGLTNWNGSQVFPCGQILGELASYYTGNALRTENDTTIRVVSALNDSNNMVIYVMGDNNPETTVTINVHDFDIDYIKTAKKFRPDDYALSDKAAPYLTEIANVNLVSSSSISFDINKLGPFEIFKIVLSREEKVVEELKLIDFETPVNEEVDYGAAFARIENPLISGLNSTLTCGQIGRTSVLWYELVDVPCYFVIPPNQTRYVHMLAKYQAQPDFIIRLNKTGNEGNKRALNSYTDLGKWQDLVFEYSGGLEGDTVRYLRLLGDCGNENNPSGFVLNNTDKFGLVDEIIVNTDPNPRTFHTSFVNEKPNKAKYLVYSKGRMIHFKSNDDKRLKVEIFNLNGHLIKKCYETAFSCPVLLAGLYLVKIGNKIEKVVVH